MNRFLSYIREPVSIVPLAAFRILFGAVMFVSILRFILSGWVYDLYIAPKFLFSYYGFEWIQPLGSLGMYLVFAILLLSFLFVMLGLYYKVAACTSFLLFTYIELLDKTNYLNHYYFISLIAFLLIFVPAGRYFAIDVWRNPNTKLQVVPRWCIGIFRLQLTFLYFFAGIAKINSDWLLSAMPLKIWLPANSHIPIFGALLKMGWVAYVFSWFAAVYDLTIAFFLLSKKSRNISYAFVVVFHLFTAVFFQIGMFPYIMILCTLVFFPAGFHNKWINYLNGLMHTWFPSIKPRVFSGYKNQFEIHTFFERFIFGFLALFFIVQLLLPFRYLAYSNDLYWSEEGYRFSWRVMLMEKAGYVIFHVKNPENGRKWEVKNYDYLTPNQEKMMSTQPDMILQFAHFMKSEYEKQGIDDVVINAECYVSLNGERSRLFIDPSVDLTKEKDSFAEKKWVLPY